MPERLQLASLGLGRSGSPDDFITVEELLERLSSIADPILNSKITKAISLLDRTFALYRPDQTALSFNGGKDSTVLLHLLRLALLPGALQQLQQQPQLQTVGSTTSTTSQQQQQQPSGAPQEDGIQLDGATPAAVEKQQQLSNFEQQKPAGGPGLGAVHSFYFERQDDFAEVRDFVYATNQHYSLGVDFLSSQDFKGGLEHYLSQHGVTAIILGTRRGDPNAEGQEYFCPSSEGWPPFMRINPILDWTYHDVWAFLRAAGVAYCCLYDQGYTSLGGVHNTLPNSALKKSDGSFAPAHMLTDGRLERVGRATAQRVASSLPPSPAAVSPGLQLRAGLLVVGDELLSGKVADTNTGFLCQQLRSIGWTVWRVVLVPDDVAAIAAEVASMSAELDVVITSGGVGPTLDDVTMEGVAAAFGTNLVRHPDLEESLLSYFGPQLTPAHLKLADAPEEGTQLIPYTRDSGEPSPFPLVACRNVFILPGVPHLLRQKWGAVKEQLQSQVLLTPFGNRVVRLTSRDEAAVAPVLDTLAAEYGSEVSIGSYPVTQQPDGAQLLVSLDCKQAHQLEAAVGRLLQLLPSEAVLSVAADVRSLATCTPVGGQPGGGSQPAAQGTQHGKNTKPKP